MPEVSATINYTKMKVRESETLSGEVITESPLTVYLNEQEIVTLLCTPEYHQELAVGFLVSEGFLRIKADLLNVEIDRDKGLAWVTVKKNSNLAQQTFLKRYITTGCGKGTTFYNLMDSSQCKTIKSDFKVKAADIIALMKAMQGSATLYHRTHGAHSSALCNHDQILILREDIGRHNATDKIAGRCFLDEIAMGDKILLTSGRLSSEIMVKAAKMGLPVLVSRSAPSDLAIKFAQDLGITIAGSVRGPRINVYTNTQRIIE